MDDNIELSQLNTRENMPQPGESFPTDNARDDGRSTENAVVLDFEDGDPTNPHNWSEAKKFYVVVVGALLSINSTMGSSIASNEITALQSFFHFPDGPQSILPATTFLIGFVLGPLVFAPFSEQYGRRPILLSTLFLYICFTLCCAGAPNWAAFLIFRFFCGMFASPPLSVTGGSLADVYDQKSSRGKANVYWSTGTLLGPLAGPVVAGFTSPYSWRWSYWVCMIVSGVCLVFLYRQPETLATKILRDRAAMMNKKNEGMGLGQYVARADLERHSLGAILTGTIKRPIKLLRTEPLVYLTCLYMAFVYAVFYMLLEIFPDIFVGIYGFTAGESGAAFFMVFAGSIITVAVQHFYDQYSAAIIRRHPNKQAEYLRLPMACVGGPLFVISLFWLGWTSKPSIPYIVPLLSMIFYGVGYQMIFMAMINYIADAYGIFASSALAACAAMRSVAGAVIPLAVKSLVDTLGIAWSCSLLAFISLALSFVPFGFIVWGEKIRAKSAFSESLQRDVHPEVELTRSLSMA